MKPKTTAVMSLLPAGALPVLAAAQTRAEVVDARPYNVTTTTTEQRELCRRNLDRGRRDCRVTAINVPAQSSESMG